MSRYLPPIAKGFSCYVDSYNLQYHIEPDGRYLYTYTVTWHDVNHNPIRRTKDASSVVAGPQFSFMKVSSKQDISPNEIKICKSLAPSNTPSSSVRECRCDGPCGKIKPVSEMRVMGLCDHYICYDCFNNAPAVETAGGFGCPNVRCYHTDLACLCTDRRRRHSKFQEIISMPQLRQVPLTSDREASPCVLTSMPCLHLVDVRLTTFIPHRNTNKVYRHQQIVEIYDNYTVEKAVDVLREYAHLKSSDIYSRIYYCSDGNINNRASWQPVKESDFSRPITDFGQENQRIDIIFDCAAA